MAPKRDYPYDISNVSPEEEKIINKCLYGYLKCSGFVRCGPEGYVMPAKFRKHADIIYNMRVRPDDVWVITFPRSGTTWTQEMVWLLKNNLNFEAAKAKPLYRRFPMLEITSHVPDLGVQLIKLNFMNLGNFQGLDSAVRTPSWEAIENAPSPRFIKTHLPLSLLPPSLLSTAKVVYVARDPRDIAVSYYYLQKLVAKSIMRATFFDFWNAFRNDLLPCTPAVSHANEAWLQRYNKNLHFIFYEDLKKNLPHEIRRACKFLNQAYPDDQLELLRRHLSFDSFQRNKHVNNTVEAKDGDGKVQFVRKGEAGGWVEYFDEKMVVQAEDYMTKRLRKSVVDRRDSHRYLVNRVLTCNFEKIKIYRNTYEFYLKYNGVLLS